MDRLLQIMRRLRAPDGCPWDREQTHQSLRPYLLEEAAEAVDAIASGDPVAMADELGDVLLQVAFHAVIAEESDNFAYPDIEQAIVEKLVRRHPHIFGEGESQERAASTPGDAAAVLRQWEAIKASERGGERSPAERVSRSLPALRRAAELAEALAWAADPELAKRSLGELSGDPELLGRALLQLAAAASSLGVDPELLLRDHLQERLAEVGGVAQG
jgi:XTP/dITP diphosphohydrolase